LFEAVISSKKLKPCEGLCINLPNGRPGIQFITYKAIEVLTITKNNRVRIQIEFDEPFIRDPSHHLEALDKEIKLEDI